MLVAQAFDLVGISAIAMSNSEPVPSDLKRGDRCMLAFERDSELFYRGKLWVSTLSKDPKKEARTGVIASAVDNVRTNDPLEHVACGGGGCGYSPIPFVGPLASVGWSRRRLTRPSTVRLLQTTPPTTPPTTPASNNTGVRWRRRMAARVGCEQCDLNGLRSCAPRLTRVGR